ncbi:hypothetical protein [Tsukamurella pseudospumae]|uniref:Uncharacterized protein n=1 Tax=Tsukamurella pseudospumae TaxID=239498 RepID=A0A138AU01_9ACTN|nr:hypothetical protein [Tsukamurella pseudospumae]KXP13925.1 hypothetical protein AXK60_22745 [Tsukamurella pseudospumae]
MATPDTQAQMIAALAGPGPTPEQVAASRAWADARRAERLDTPIPCTPDPTTARCADMSCPSCWLDAAAASDILPLPELSAPAHQAAHDSWRAAWLPYLCRTITQSLHAERAITDAGDAERLGPQARELLADDARASVHELASALAPRSEHRPLLHVTAVLADMVRQSERALLDLAAGRAGALRMCASLYVRLRAVAEDMLGVGVIPAAQLPVLADFEQTTPAVTHLRDVTVREPSPAREDGE